MKQATILDLPSGDTEDSVAAWNTNSYRLQAGVLRESDGIRGGDKDNLENRDEVFREAGKSGEEAYDFRASQVHDLWEAWLLILPEFLGDFLEP